MGSGTAPRFRRRVTGVDAVIVGEAVHQDDRGIPAGDLGDVDPPVGRLHVPFVSSRDGGRVVWDGHRLLLIRVAGSPPHGRLGVFRCRRIGGA